MGLAATTSSKSRLYLARAEAAIVAEFGHVVSIREAVRLLSGRRAELKLPESATSVVERLEETGRCQRIAIDGSPYASLERLAFADYDLFDVGRSLRSDAAYFSHGTAVFLNGLTTDIPTLLYLNREQTPKPVPRGALTQSGIDRAFSSKARRTSLVYRCDRGQIAILSGKNTGNFEVGTATTPALATVATTKVERTLIDIAVRPDYAGGPFKVRDAYAEAVRRGLSTNTLIATLRRIDHKYPYHQAIGLYLERAGASGAVLDRLHQIPAELDFYLTHRIEDPEYVPEWKIYIPRGL